MKQVTYYNEPSAKDILKGALKKPLKIVANMLIATIEMIESVDEMFFMPDDSILKRIEYAAALVLMCGVGFGTIALCLL